jgi:hypothetical protein
MFYNNNLNKNVDYIERIGDLLIPSIPKASAIGLYPLPHQL